MITTTTVARKTGLHLKTLTRWVDRGFIPKPAIGTHPSGRGKIGYWPDSVLERCQRIAKLRKQGHSLESAICLLGMEEINQAIERSKQPTSAQQFAQHKVKLKDGRQVPLLEVFRASVAEVLKESVLDRDRYRAVLEQLGADEHRLLQMTIGLLENGYNPFLVDDGATVQIKPDFLLGHPTRTCRPFLALPLLPPWRKFLSVIHAEQLDRAPVVWAAPKVWAREGDVTMEYGIFLGGPLGFEVLRELASTVSVRPQQGEKP